MSVGGSGNVPGVASDQKATTNPNKPVCNASMVPFTSDDMFELPCKHRYCSQCLKFFFTRAMKDETSCPPTCCQIKIPLRLAVKCFSKSFVRFYKAKQLELRTRNKTYCHRPACSTFVAPHSIHNGHACCQRCGSITCGHYKSAWHWERCSEDDGTGFFELVKTAAWKRCPKCKRMIEKSEGCDHIRYVYMATEYMIEPRWREQVPLRERILLLLRA
jgi:hypothetical protein